MKLIFLGTGTSIGSPSIGCQCAVCRSTEPKDKRLRTSAIVETGEGFRILIDCGPDFRQQILQQEFTKFDAVLISHIHYDHVGGMDDLRPFSLFGDVDVYAKKDVVEGLHTTMPYCFKEVLYPGVPHLRLHEVKAGAPIILTRKNEVNVTFPASGADLDGTLNTMGRKMYVPAIDGQLEIMPVEVMHGNLPILGYRIGKLAYITDMKTITPENEKLLKGVEVLVVNALRFEKEHHSHQLVNDAIAFSKSIGAKRTYLIHVTHDIGTHDLANAKLPAGIHFPYDGECVEV